MWLLCIVYGVHTVVKSMLLYINICVRKFPFTVLTFCFFFFLPCPDARPNGLDLECNSDTDCPTEKACINLHCINPCSLRGACGENALCRAIVHKPRCSCPQCYVGLPQRACKPDPQCDISKLTPSEIPAIECSSNADCPANMACNHGSRECYSPCRAPSSKCRENKKCEVHAHRAVCVCKSGFVVNDRGELMCAPEHAQCTRDAQCPSNRACADGRCVDPCSTRHNPCGSNKTCEVLDHRPVCICMRDCNPSLSICLRDSGCPRSQACRNYKCEDPCLTASCRADAPCYVEDHRPVCKFCPPGFVTDSKYGCLKGKLLLPGPRSSLLLPDALGK